MGFAFNTRRNLGCHGVELKIPGHHLLEGIAHQIAGLDMKGMFSSMSDEHRRELAGITSRILDLAHRAQTESDLKFQSVTHRLRWWQQPWFESHG